MPEHEDFYTPAHIDEQIDALLQTRSMPARDLRLTDDLRAILKHENENTRSLHTVLQKLMEDTSEQPRAKILSIAEKQQQGRSVVMQKSSHPQKSRVFNSMVRVWSTLAAVLVVAILVGSMLLILNTIHQTKNGSSTANTKDETPTTAPTPTLPEGQIIYTSGNNMSLSLAWSPDGKRVATALNLTTVESWDAQTGKNIVSYPVATNSKTPNTVSRNSVDNVAWSPDGSKLLVAETHTIYLFDASTARLIRTFTASALAEGRVAPAPLIATRGVGQDVPFSSLVPLSGTSIFNNAVWSPNGQSIAAVYDAGWGGSQSVTAIWDANSGLLVKKLSGFSANIVSVTWSPQENRLAALGYDGMVSTVKVWDTDSWDIVKQYPNTTAFDWSPTGAQMALVGSDKTGQGTNSVTIVDAATGNTVKQITDAQATHITDVHWSPDGSRLALETQNPLLTISIWSATDGTLLYTFPQKGVYEATWSPDSKYISCAQTKETVKRTFVMITLIWVA